MPIAESILVLTDEEGTVTRLPVLKSSLIKFERRYKRNFNTDSIADSATMAYYLAHEQTWPPADTVLEEWFDSVHFAAEEAEPPGSNGDRPTPPPAPE
jgi:hypothetical protein